MKKAIEQLTMWITCPVTTSFGMSGRVEKGEDLTDFYEIQTPLFGFYWWVWLPRCHSNGGRVHRGEVFDFSIFWLCFRCNITFWYQAT